MDGVVFTLVKEFLKSTGRIIIVALVFYLVHKYYESCQGISGMADVWPEKFPSATTGDTGRS